MFHLQTLPYLRSSSYDFSDTLYVVIQRKKNWKIKDGENLNLAKQRHHQRENKHIQ